MIPAYWNCVLKRCCLINKKKKCRQVRASMRRGNQMPTIVTRYAFYNYWVHVETKIKIMRLEGIFDYRAHECKHERYHKSWFSSGFSICAKFCKVSCRWRNQNRLLHNLLSVIVYTQQESCVNVYRSMAHQDTATCVVYWTVFYLVHMQYV